MTDWIEITGSDLDLTAAGRFVTDGTAGGIDVFLGTTRAETAGGKSLVALDYEAYESMAVAQFKIMAAEARGRWPVVRLVILHRIGRVEVGKPSVLIAVSTPHRADAFEACRFLIDRLKQVATIWKAEVWDDGSTSRVEGVTPVGSVPGVSVATASDDPYSLRLEFHPQPRNRVSNFKDVVVPQDGQAITISDGVLNVPDRPIIPFIEGDGTGPDIWRASVRVFDAAVRKAFGGKKKIAWMEVFAGEKSFKKYNSWLHDETVPAFQQYLVGIKGPLTTPVGGGIRSLNVALRQLLDLYVCLRPVQYFEGVPSPVKRPEKVDMTIFRENTEDIYAGIEYAAGTAEANKVLEFLETSDPKSFGKIRFNDSKKTTDFAKAAMPRDVADQPVEVGIGIKPVSKMGSQRLIYAAIEHAIKHKRKSVTLVHKGNIMKFTEGAFRDWGYELAKDSFGAVEIDGGPWCVIKNGVRGNHSGNDIVIKDAIADITLQQVLTRPEDFDVIATLNLNGDYLSDALAAQVGGIGIAPGGNINYITGHAIFEATHGTAPKYADQDVVNPGSVILSGAMMFEHLGWQPVADLIVSGLKKAIAAKTVTYDFARLMDGATKVKCSQFADEMIKHMG